jgi:hypothetical protein
LYFFEKGSLKTIGFLKLQLILIPILKISSDQIEGVFALW